MLRRTRKYVANASALWLWVLSMKMQATANGGTPYVSSALQSTNKRNTWFIFTQFLSHFVSSAGDWGKARDLVRQKLCYNNCVAAENRNRNRHKLYRWTESFLQYFFHRLHQFLSACEFISTWSRWVHLIFGNRFAWPQNNWKRTEQLTTNWKETGDFESEIEDKEIQTIKFSNAAEIKRNEQIQRNSNRFVHKKNPLKELKLNTTPNYRF